MSANGTLPCAASIMIDAAHPCMTACGIRKPAASRNTTHFTGLFREDHDMERRFLDLVRGSLADRADLDWNL